MELDIRCEQGEGRDLGVLGVETWMREIKRWEWNEKE